MGITMAGVPSESNSGICGTDGFIVPRAATGQERPLLQLFTLTIEKLS